MNPLIAGVTKKGRQEKNMFLNVENVLYKQYDEIQMATHN